jgi:hypothetical protein
LSRDLISNEELLGNLPGVVGVTEADREELLMLGIS